MELREYQEKACQTTVDGFKKTHKQLIVLPTGSGKTFVFWNIIKRMGLKTLVLVNTREIQKHTIETGNKSFSEFTHKVNVCTVQSAMYIKKLNKLKNENYDLIIVDECHHSCAGGYRKIFDYLEIKHKYILGVTATPFRKDGQSVYELFGKPNFTISLDELISLGFLCDLQGYRIKTNCSLTGVRKNKGDFQKNQLESVINTKNRNQLIVNEYIKLANGEKAIVFCVSVKHALEIKNGFLLKGISCEVIHGKMSKMERDLFLLYFKTGRIKILANCQILTEGFDEPSITTLLMARPTCSKTLYVQMIGRGARIFPGKEQCKILEFTDNNFSIFDLSQCYDERKHKLKMKEGETFSHFVKRVKDLPEGHEDTIVEKIDIVPKFTTTDGATPWQIEELTRRGIKIPDQITQTAANYLLSQV
jgi:superfamily II DNA or RNA helicase